MRDRRPEFFPLKHELYPCDGSSCVVFEDEVPYPRRLERVSKVRGYDTYEMEVVRFQDSDLPLGRKITWYAFNDGTIDGPVVLGRNLKRTYKLAKLTFAKTSGL